MGKNKIYLLAGVFAALILIAYLATADRGSKTETDKTEGKEKVFFAVDSAAVNKINIEYKGKSITLTKDGGEWKETSPVSYKVEQKFIGAMLSDLKNYKIDSKVSSNPEKKDSYGFNDSSKTIVTVYENGNKKGSIVIGANSAGSNLVFVKKPEDNNIYLADGIIRYNIVKEDLNEWRDKQIVSIAMSEISSVEMILPAETFKITKDSLSKFYIGKDSIPNTAIMTFLNVLSNMNTQKFYDKPLDSPKYSATIKVEQLGGKMTEINFLKEDVNPVMYLVKTNTSPQVFEINEALFGSIAKSKASFLKGDATTTNVSPAK
ncbi:hypothetical protein BH10BAC5_BH10BAC5_17590 [soil metagenome]